MAGMTQEALAYTKEIQSLVDLYGLTDRTKGTGYPTNTASTRNLTTTNSNSSTSAANPQDVIAAAVRPFGRKFVYALEEFTARLSGCMSLADAHGPAAGQTGASLHPLSVSGGFPASTTSSAVGA